MAERHRTMMGHLRASRLAGFLATLVLVLQVVLSTDHLGAAAASAFGPHLGDEAVGLLSLCHGDGTIAFVDESSSDGEHPAPLPPCILCVGATLAAQAMAATAPLLPLPDAPVFVEAPVFVVAVVATPPLLRYGSTRGPPASFAV